MAGEPIIRGFKANDAQMSMDFLIGVTIFSITFLFVAQSISGLFVPFHSESEDVQNMANRVAAFLVEEPLGLAKSSKDPCVITLEKARELNSSLNNSLLYESKRIDLGLVTSGRKFDVLVELQCLNGTVYRGNSTAAVIQAGMTPPDFSTLAQSKRVVLLKDNSELLILSVKVW